MTIPFQAYLALGAMVALIVLIQRRLYREAVRGAKRWIMNAVVAHRAELLLQTAFLLLNLPWVFL